MADRAPLEAIEAFDSFAGLRNGLRALAAERNEWAGFPMPLEGSPLVVEPKFPRAEAIMAATRRKSEDHDPPDDTQPAPVIRNVFYSHKRQSDIVVFEETGSGGGRRIDWGLHPRVHGLDHMMSTLGASVAWGIEQEARAVQLLGTLIRPHTFKHYMLTGMFLESSERSGVVYLFRRLRPTVAMSGATGKMRILAALCLHPIAYYEGSWAGAMCPTDDVIAHLMLMRGDEPMFWKRANQHAPHRPEAGL